MSDVKKRCAACRNEKPVSEMKVCMHSQMHYYVCDAKCMHDFYNPPKAEKTGHAAIIAALQSSLSAAEAERDQLRLEVKNRQHTIDGMNEAHWQLVQAHAQLRAELEAIRGQQPDAWPTLDKPAKVGPVRFNPGLSARLVVEAAQRQHEYSQWPEVEAARLERFGAFMREVHGENGDGGASDGP